MWKIIQGVQCTHPDVCDDVLHHNLLASADVLVLVEGLVKAARDALHESALSAVPDYLGQVKTGCLGRGKKRLWMVKVGKNKEGVGEGDRV